MYDRSVIVAGVVAQRVAEYTQFPVAVPDPVKDALYTVGAASLAWLVGAVLSWLSRILKRRG